ncbi:hypothetical protein HDU96_009947 [Phlyctochytrium bullatum]|nr:hypothetical protein HDU96_009947 [Phlyctochytrium bullatum]
MYASVLAIVALAASASASYYGAEPLPSTTSVAPVATATAEVSYEKDGEAAYAGYAAPSPVAYGSGKETTKSAATTTPSYGLPETTGAAYKPASKTAGNYVVSGSSANTVSIGFVAAAAGVAALFL